MRRTDAPWAGSAPIGPDTTAGGGRTAAPDDVRSTAPTTGTTPTVFDSVDMLSGAAKQATRERNTARLSLSLVTDGRTEREAECVLRLGADAPGYACTYRFGSDETRVLSLPTACT
ncbi:MAG TPA: hypothetical protein VIL00_10815 [Pseudonocardiaceae bacterium]